MPRSFGNKFVIIPCTAQCMALKWRTALSCCCYQVKPQLTTVFGCQGLYGTTQLLLYLQNQKTNKQKLYDRKRCITCMAVFYSVGTNVLKKDFRRRKEKEIN